MPTLRRAPLRALSALLPLLLGLALTLAGPAAAAPPEVLGLEQQVSSRAGAQGVAFDRAGNYVVVAHTSSVVAQRFDARGAPLGDEITVSASGASSGLVDVGRDAAGNFVVVWDRGVYSGGYVTAQRYNAAGTRRGTAFQVGAKTSGDDVNVQSQVAMADDGSFLVVWRHSTYDPNLPGNVSSVRAQRFAADGSALGGEIVVANTGGDYCCGGSMAYPAVALDGSRNAVIAWRDGPGVVRFARYDEAGALLDSGLASADTGLNRDNPSVATDAAGNFAIAWREVEPGPSFNFKARLFTAAGTPRGDVFQLNDTSGTGSRGRVALAPGGDLLAAWIGYECGCGAEPLYLRRFAATGAALGPAFRLNEAPAHFHVDVAFDRSGQAIVVWNNYSQYSYARRIGQRPLPVAISDVNADGAPDLGLVATRGSSRELLQRSGATGAPLGIALLKADLSAVDALAVADRNGNGIGELAVLGQHRSSHRIEVQVRDADTGSMLAALLFLSSATDLARHYRPVALAALPGSGELAVLASVPAGGGRVQVRDAVTGGLLRTSAILGATFRPQALAAIPDFSGNGAGELVALGEHATTHAAQLQVRDAASGALLNTVNPLPAGYRPAAMATIPDRTGNGVAEIAVLGQALGSGALLVRVRDAQAPQSAGALNAFAVLDAGFSADALALVPDVNGNGRPELAVLGRHGDGRVVVEVRDNRNGALVRSIAYELPGFAPEGLAVSPDIDGNGMPELTVIGVGAGYRSQTRDALTGALVSEASY